MTNYTTVIALYDNFNQAERAIDSLINSGFRRDNISIIANDTSEEYKRYVETLDIDEKGNVRNNDDPGAGEGAAFGAVVGTLTGLGIALLPGVGPVLAIGPWAAALISGIGAATGAAAGGLTAGLVDLGADEDEAQAYAESVRRGGTLVLVRAAAEDEDEIADILENYNAVDIKERQMAYRRQGWAGFDETTEQPYTAQQVNTYRNQYTDADNVATAEVVQEEMHVGKREVEHGGVRVRKYMTEDTVSEDVNLRREEIHVDRHPVNRRATEADFNTFEEGTVTMTEHEEVPVVEKEARVVEEVDIYKDVDYDSETVKGTVRRTDVDVEEMDANTFEEFETDFQTHFNDNYRGTSYNYNQYRPAYRYGYNLAASPRYTNSDWRDVEPEARMQWERNNRGTWDQVKDAVRHGWVCTRESITS